MSCSEIVLSTRVSNPSNVIIFAKEYEIEVVGVSGSTTVGATAHGNGDAIDSITCTISNLSNYYGKTLRITPKLGTYGCDQRQITGETFVISVPTATGPSMGATNVDYPTLINVGSNIGISTNVTNYNTSIVTEMGYLISESPISAYDANKAHQAVMLSDNGLTYTHTVSEADLGRTYYVRPYFLLSPDVCVESPAFGEQITMMVAKKAVTVTAASVSRAYNGTALTSNLATATGLVEGHVLYSYNVVGSQTNVGTATNTVSNAVIKDANNEIVTQNYDITYEPGVLTVIPKEVTVKAGNASKTYGQSDPTEFSTTISGRVADETLTYTVSRATGENVGTYTITPAGEALQGNYAVIYQTGDFTITPASATVTAAPKSKVYGETDPQWTATVSGLISGDAENVITYTLARTAGENVGTYAITPEGETTQGNYNVTYVPANLTITKATATVTANAQTKVFGETDPELTVGVSGLQNGDAASVISYTVGRVAGENVGTYTITPTGDAVQGNYDVVYETGTLTISKATATVTANAQTKVYGESDPTLTVSVSGLQNGDAASVISYTVSRTDGETVGTYAITPAGETVQGNYNVTYVPSELTITKATATVTADANTKVYGEADPTPFTVTISGLQNNDDESVISYTVSRATGENVGTYAITPAGAAVQGNYNVTYVPSEFTITKATATVTAVDNAKVYGEADPTPFTATVSGLQNNDDENVIFYSLSRVAGENVGTYIITPSGAAVQGNYDVVYETGTFTISKATATVTADAKTKVYGEADPTPFTVTISGLQNNDDESVISYSVSRVTGENVGTYAITPSGTNVQGNYMVLFVPAELTITKATATVTADAKTKVYGESDPASFTAAVSGLQNGDVASVISYTVSRAAGENVGTYTITPSGAAVQGNYEVVYVTGTFTISKATATVTANAKTKVYGESDPTPFTATVSGLKNNDSEGVISYSVTRETGDSVGTYAITPAGAAEQGNYNVTYVPADLTITKATATVTANAKTKVYGETDPTFTATVTGLKNNDNESVIVYSLSRATGENVGTYAITPAGDAEQGNYNVVFVADDLTITKATATVTADTKSKVYGESDPTFTATITGLQNNDSENVISYTVGRETGEDVGTYAITPAGDTEQGNYNVTYVSANLTISKATVNVTITGNSDEYNYDGNEHTVNGYSFVSDNDSYTEQSVNFSGSASVARKNAGTSVMGLADSQFSNNNSNFDVTFTVNDGSITINPIDVIVTIVGSTDTKDYDGAAHTVTGYTASASTALYDVEQDFTFNGTATATQTNAGTATMGLASDQFNNTNSNFANVTFNVTTDGSITINPIDVTVTIVGSTNTRDYDGAAHTVTGYTASASTALYDVEQDFTFNGTATATQTNVGTATMGLAADQFTNTNINFGTVTFNVTDGYQTINPISATVTITGHNNTTAFDGSEHSVTGYEVEITPSLYTENDFTFNGNAVAARTDQGTTNMGLTAEQFSNNNNNFANVTFNVTDGYQTITPVDEVVVTITGHHNTVAYDGEEHTVSGYDVQINNQLYTESDYTFNGTAEVARTDAGTAYMGLDASQFTNTNTNFSTVTFNVIDGYQTINPIDATVTIVGENNITSYNGVAHTVSGYTASASTALYDVEHDFTFNATATATQTNVGTATMGLAADQFTNTNTNFGTVTFNVTDGFQTITKATATVTANAKSKVYGDEDPSLDASQTGVFGTDALNYSLSRATGENVGEYAIIVTLGENPNYNVTATNGTFTITQATATVTVVNKTKVYGTADPELTAEVTGVVGTDALNYSLSRAIGETAGEYVITVTLGNNPNYNVTATNGTFTITQATATVTAVNKSKVYGTTDPQLTAEVTGLKGNDVLNYSLSRDAGENVGEYAIVVTLGNNPNYTVTSTNGIFTITKAAATVTANATSKVYGESEPVLTATTTGVVGTDALNYSLSRAAGENIGEYAITVTLGDNPNYEVTATNGTFTITQATATVTADAKSKVYGEDDPTLTATVTGTVGTDVLNYTLSRASGESVGNYTVIVTLGSNPNYTVTATNGTFTITRAAATVTAVAQTKVYGSADPTLTASVSGLQNDDAASVISYTVSRVAGEDVGTYTITPSGDAEQANYNVSYETANLTITPAPATVQANDASKYVGQEDPTLTATVTGLFGSDAIQYTVTRTAGETAGTYTITALGNDNQGNYAVTYIPGVFTISTPPCPTLGRTTYTPDLAYSSSFNNVTITVTTEVANVIFPEHIQGVYYMVSTKTLSGNCTVSRAEKDTAIYVNGSISMNLPISESDRGTTFILTPYIVVSGCGDGPATSSSTIQGNTIEISVPFMSVSLASVSSGMSKRELFSNKGIIAIAQISNFTVEQAAANILEKGFLISSNPADIQRYSEARKVTETSNLGNGRLYSYRIELDSCGKTMYMRPYLKVKSCSGNGFVYVYGNIDNEEMWAPKFVVSAEPNPFNGADSVTLNASARMSASYDYQGVTYVFAEHGIEEYFDLWSLPEVEAQNIPYNALIQIQNQITGQGITANNWEYRWTLEGSTTPIFSSHTSGTTKVKPSQTTTYRAYGDLRYNYVDDLDSSHTWEKHCIITKPITVVVQP